MMSYANQGQRRPAIQHAKITSAHEAEQIANEAVGRANQRIAEIKAMANKQTAEFEAWADHCELQAKIAWEENRELRERVAELEAEVGRLRKKVSRKSGKHKGEEWEDES